MRRNSTEHFICTSLDTSPSNFYKTSSSKSKHFLRYSRYTRPQSKPLRPRTTTGHVVSPPHLDVADTEDKLQVKGYPCQINEKMLLFRRRLDISSFFCAYLMHEPVCCMIYFFKSNCVLFKAFCFKSFEPNTVFLKG